MTAMSPRERLEFAVLEAAVSSQRGIVSTSAIEAAGTTRADIVEATKSLEHRGYVKVEWALSGDGHLIPLPPGRNRVLDVQSRRQDRRERTLAVRNAVLRWLYDSELDTHHATYLSKFGESVYNDFLGSPFTDVEAAHATEHLQDLGLVKGPRAGNGPGVLRPQITMQGMRLVEQGEDVNKPDQPQHSSVTINGAVRGNLMVQSPGAHQRYTSTTDDISAAVIEALLPIRQMVPALDISPEAVDELTALIESAEKSAAGSEPGILRKTIEKIIDRVTEAPATALGAMGAAQLTQLLANASF